MDWHAEGVGMEYVQISIACLHIPICIILPIFTLKSKINRLLISLDVSKVTPGRPDPRRVKVTSPVFTQENPLNLFQCKSTPSPFLLFYSLFSIPQSSIMPPKRKSTDSAASGAKKPKGSTTNPEVDMETKRALDKRWAPVSVSRNADSEFRLQTRDPVKAYAYVCLGRAPWNTRQNDEFEDEYEEDEESIEQKKKDDAVSDLLLRRERSVSGAGVIADSISGGG